MEVPFFCVAEGLVVLEDGRAVGEGKGKGAGEGNERAAGTEGGDGNAAGKSKRKGTVSEKELEALRGRMMGLLEDLCGEEVELGE